MGAAEVISFEEVRARKQWSILRQQLHERFDQWLDTLEQAWHEAGSDPVRTAMLSEVAGALPPPVQERLRDGVVVEPTSPQPPVTWSLSRHNAHYAFASSIASATDSPQAVCL
mgnify:CR=1 FL=1